MRRHDWPERLAAYIDARREEPFAYGVHDCCQFAAGAVEALTGENPAARWSYADEAEAQRLLAQHGGVDGLVTLALGEPLHPSRAHRGDVVVGDFPSGAAAGVLLGNECVFPSAVGLVFHSRAIARLAWRVR